VGMLRWSMYALCGVLGCGVLILGIGKWILTSQIRTTTQGWQAVNSAFSTTTDIATALAADAPYTARLMRWQSRSRVLIFMAADIVFHGLLVAAILMIAFAFGYGQ
jgi:hypothetical protein